MHPTVPREEIARRLAAFQTALRENDLTGAVIVQAVDLYYFAGTAQNAHLIVPAEGEPALYVRKSLERARRESPLERIRPLRSLRALPEALAACGLEGDIVGMELDVLPANAYLAYGRLFGGFELTDCSPIIRRLRCVKSSWELQRIASAATVLDDVIGSVPGVIRKGMSEIEVAAELERLLRRRGHEGIVRFRAFNQEIGLAAVMAGPAATLPGGSDTPLVGLGPSVAVPKGASPRQIRRGEPIVVDLTATCEGYLADEMRTFCLGPVPGQFAEAHEAARRILTTVASEARPGVTCGALYELAQALADGSDGFMGAGEDRVSFVGHGFGLEIDEPPFLADGHELALAEGMVFALEPKFVMPGEGAVGIENSYVVTAGGAKPLTHSPETLLEIELS